MRKFITATGGLVAASVLLAACGGSDSGTSKSAETYDVVLIAGVTGPVASITSNVSKSLEFEVEQLNADGGIGGRKVTLTVLDSASDPTRAVSKLQELIAKGDKPDLVAAGITSAETLALVPQLTREKILSVSASSNGAANDPKKYPYHFGATPPTSDQLKTLPAQVERLGAKKLSVLVGDDVFGQGTTEAVKSLMDGTGTEVNYFTFKATDVDFTTAYSRATAGSPDAIFMDGNGDAIGRLLTAREKSSLDLPALGGAGMTTVAPTLLVEANALTNFESVVFAATQFKPEGERSERLNEFLTALKFGDKQSAFVSLLQTDALRSVALAADQAKSTDTETVAKQLENLEQPEAGYWFTQPETMGYSAENHFPIYPTDAYAWITPLALKDGLWVSK